MTCKQRVFSHTFDLNYADYNKNKKGNEILKTLKNEYNNTTNPYKESLFELNKFQNHADFLTISHSYYNFLYDKCGLEFVQNMYNSNISSVDEDKKDGLLEQEQKQNNNCKERKAILYPYGQFETQQKCNFLYPYKIDISKWCNQKEPCNYPFWLSENYPICEPKPNTQKSDKSSCSLPGLIGGSCPIYLPVPVILSAMGDANSFHEKKTCKGGEQMCDRYNTILCKKGLCKTCNKNKRNEKCECRKDHHSTKQTLGRSNQKFKTGASF